LARFDKDKRGERNALDTIENKIDYGSLYQLFLAIRSTRKYEEHTKETWTFVNFSEVHRKSESLYQDKRIE
jgi:hypothetical protein